MYLPLSASSLLGNRDYIDKYLLSMVDIDILYGWGWYLSDNGLLSAKQFNYV